MATTRCPFTSAATVAGIAAPDTQQHSPTCITTGVIGLYWRLLCYAASRLSIPTHSYCIKLQLWLSVKKRSGRGQRDWTPASHCPIRKPDIMKYEGRRPRRGWHSLHSASVNLKKPENRTNMWRSSSFCRDAVNKRNEWLENVWVIEYGFRHTSVAVITLLGAYCFLTARACVHPWSYNILQVC